MDIKFWSENLKEKDQLRIILNCIFEIEARIVPKLYWACSKEPSVRTVIAAKLSAGLSTHPRSKFDCLETVP
jgi:hypothetical protein